MLSPEEGWVSGGAKLARRGTVAVADGVLGEKVRVSVPAPDHIPVPSNGLEAA